MIDRATWILLADRLDDIRWHQEAQREQAETITLEFDSHDQARVVRHGLDGSVIVGDTPAVLPP